MEPQPEMNPNMAPQFITGVFYKRGQQSSGEQIFLKRIKVFPQNNSNVALLLILPILHKRDLKTTLVKVKSKVVPVLN
jgi:hypothetical protein